MKKTILVVEDDRPLAEAIKEKLESEGFNTLICYSVDEALSHFKKKEEIDAVWLDHYLPEKNGLELVIYMKKLDLKYIDTPIFLVSNSSSTEKIYQYLQLGVNGYFAKAESKIDDIVENIKKTIEENE